MKDKPIKKRASIESQLSILTLVANIVPSVLLLTCLWFFDVSGYLLGIVFFFAILLSLYCVSAVWQKTQFHFRSLHNLLDSLAQGDYSFRGPGQASGGAFGDLIKTVNSLASTLQKQRLLSEESQLLLRKVVDQIDVAIITWDQNDQILLINPAARELLGLTGELSTLVLPQVLVFANKINTGDTQVKTLVFDNKRGQFRLHKESFIAEGCVQNLLFMTNISNILRTQEKKAWQNLIRVLSHEINNSLVPLSSLSTTLKKQVQKREKDPVLAKELIDGISVIAKRSESLAAFVKNYHKISKLPQPDKKQTDLKALIITLVALFPEEDIQYEGATLKLMIDSAQIEQVLINLLKNAVEANQSYRDKFNEGGQVITITWGLVSDRLVLEIIDTGEGIYNSENLFTPFYTTKAKGSGIGLVFCQQVIEAHGGYLIIANREKQHGCKVSIELPL